MSDRRESSFTESVEPEAQATPGRWGEKRICLSRDFGTPGVESESEVGGVSEEQRAE